MDAKLKARWVDALRSGEFKQAIGAMQRQSSDGESFCCLGVLCVVGGEDIPDEFGNRDPNYVWVREQIDDESDTLQFLNDRGKSFDEIADFIEANL